MENLITYENKTAFGVIGIILAFICWVCAHFSLEFISILIIILFNLPSILLIMPDPKIKNNKSLAIITTILLSLLLLLFLLIMIFNKYLILWIWLDIFSIIYNFFCAYLLTIQTEPNQTNTLYYNMSNNTRTTFDKYCSECGHGLMNDAQFCPGCGRNLNPTDGESTVKEDEKDEHKCKNCGTEINEKHIFCPECGEKIKE